jgi:hypothetical protein
LEKAEVLLRLTEHYLVPTKVHLKDAEEHLRLAKAHLEAAKAQLAPAEAPPVSTDMEARLPMRSAGWLCH